VISGETDQNSGCMVRDGKQKGVFYLDHLAVDLRLCRQLIALFSQPETNHQKSKPH
jgi:hypothetical protein